MIRENSGVALAGHVGLVRKDRNWDSLTAFFEKSPSALTEGVDGMAYIPKAGEPFARSDWRFEVVEMDRFLWSATAVSRTEFHQWLQHADKRDGGCNPPKQRCQDIDVEKPVHSPAGMRVGRVRRWRSVNSFVAGRVEHGLYVLDRGVLFEEIRGGEEVATAGFADADDLAGGGFHFLRGGGFQEADLVEIP